ncbi:hypothetical protein TNCV_2572171 [Trichonephila clavipes]|nr:hypothetical protein TNCV_2572171 [Trichonephila clavipes]
MLEPRIIDMEVATSLVLTYSVAYTAAYGLRNPCCKCEEDFEKLSDSQERLPVTEPSVKVEQFHASEPQLQLGSGRLLLRWTLR